MIGGKQGSVDDVAAKISAAELSLSGNWQTASGEFSTTPGPARVSTARAQSHFGPRMLIIAEDQDLGDWLLDELRYAGSPVALATSGREGLELLRSAPVDVVVSEEGLRDLPGVDLLHALAGMAQMPKVILTTSRQSDFLDARAIQNGASAVLHKPFRMEQLFASIARALGH